MVGKGLFRKGSENRKIYPTAESRKGIQKLKDVMKTHFKVLRLEPRVLIWHLVVSRSSLNLVQLSPVETSSVRDDSERREEVR